MNENRLTDESTPRASTGQRNQATRYRIADPVIPVLSYEFDEHLIEFLSNQLKEALEIVYGSRCIEAITPELKLSISLWFYFATILFMHRTPGQEMFGVHLLQEEAERKIFPGVFMRRYRTMANVPINTLVKLSFLYALVPYAYERRLYIASWIRHLWTVIISDDDEASSSRAQSVTIHFQSTSSVRPRSWFVSMMNRFAEAVVRAWRGIATDHATRIDLALATAREFYLMLFCLDGRFYELALQAFGMRSLIKESQSRRRGATWRLFGWLLAFRLTILGVDSIRQIYRQYMIIRRESEAITQAASSDQQHINTETIQEPKHDAATSTAEQLKCPLCMDPLSQPAAMQCGHIYCWNCIVPWSQRQKRSHSSYVAGVMIKCPVCRHPSRQQTIRPVYL